MKRLTRCLAVGLVALACGSAFAADDADDKGCPKILEMRGVHELIDAHLAAMKLRAPQSIACNYADDAVLVMTGTAAGGRNEVAHAFEALFAAVGDVDVHVVTVTESGDVALLEYTLERDNAVVLRGVDTFVADRGLIRVQTHAEGSPHNAATNLVGRPRAVPD